VIGPKFISKSTLTAINLPNAEMHTFLLFQSEISWRVKLQKTNKIELKQTTWPYRKGEPMSTFHQIEKLYEENSHAFW